MMLVKIYKWPYVFKTVARPFSAPDHHLDILVQH